MEVSTGEPSSSLTVLLEMSGSLRPNESPELANIRTKTLRVLRRVAV